MAYIEVSDEHQGNVIGTEEDDVIIGTSASELFEGRGGDDSIVGNGGGDYIVGQAGNDTLIGGDGDDHLLDGDGDDSMEAGGGADSIIVGNGADIGFGGAGSDVFYVEPDAGDDYVDAGPDNDTVFYDIMGETGRDTILGGDGDDQFWIHLWWGGSEMTTMGGDGDVRLSIPPMTGLVDGGDGEDTLVLDWEDHTTYAHFLLDLAAGSITPFVDASVGVSVSGIENVRADFSNGGSLSVVGTDMADHLEAHVLNQLFVDMGDGDDSFEGSASSYEGASPSYESGTFDMGSGNDTLDVNLSPGGGTVTGGDGDDLLDIYASRGLDLDAGDGDDTVLVRGLGSGVIDAGSGNDSVTLELSSGDGVSIDAGTGHDTVSGGARGDVIAGNLGDDQIDAGEGDDSIAPGAGSDTVLAGAGDDTVSHFAGDQPLDGGADSVDGGDGVDVITLLDGGRDTVLGGEGDDALHLHVWAAEIEGGAGNDTLMIDTVGDDLSLWLDLATGRLTSPDDPAVDATISGVEAWGATMGRGDLTVTGSEGDDLLEVSEVSGGATFMNLGGGNDMVRLADASTEPLDIDLGAGADLLDLGGAQPLDPTWLDLEGTVENIGLTAGVIVTGVEHFVMSRSADQFRGDAADNMVEGGLRSDRLYGRDGNDVLDGGGGADALYGNLGADVMTGGEGQRDRFIYFNIVESGVGAGNRDVITDFETGLDRIEIRRFDADVTLGFKQAFDFVGDAGLSGVAGELAYAHEGGNTIVMADVDGDGLADFEIGLTGIMDLGADDFLI